MEAVKQSVPELSEDQVLLISKALADPRRMEILRQIGAESGSVGCTGIRDAQSVTPATLSHHMKELEIAGLVRATKAGKFVNYNLRRDVLQAYLGQLAKI